MRTLITGGTVISMDPAIGDLDRGDVLLENDVIVDVAEHIDASDAVVIDASDRVVIPGFVDTHRHTWQTAFRGVGVDWTFAQYLVAVHGTLKPHYQPEDVYLGNLLGRLEALHSGVTTMLDWFHCGRTPEHVDAAVQGLRDAPARSILCYGAGWGTTAPVDDEVRRVRSELTGSGPVTMALGLRGPELTDMGTVVAELTLAADLRLRTSVHIETGGRYRPIADLHEHGLLSSTTTFVHANGVGDDELHMLADAGSSVSISPDVELKMGIGWPMTGRVLAAGLRPSCPPMTLHRLVGTCSATMRGASPTGLDALAAHVAQRGRRRDPAKRRRSDRSPSSDPARHDRGGAIERHRSPSPVAWSERRRSTPGRRLPTLRNRLVESRDRIAAAAGVPLDGTWHPSTDLH